VRSAFVGPQAFVARSSLNFDAVPFGGVGLGMGQMDHLRKFMEVLRTLVRQRLSAAIEGEPKQGGDWRMMREYVQLCCVFECPVQIEEWESGSNASLSLLKRYLADLKSGHFGNKSPL
jgi:hypothetical protein